MKPTYRAAVALALITLLIPRGATPQTVQHGSDVYKPIGLGFSVTLILANGDSNSIESLPDPAANALASVRDSLPFRSYQLLDTQLMTGSNRALIRLRGLDGRRYALRLKAGLLLPGRVAVSQCQLWELPPEGTSLGARPDDAAALATGHLVGPDTTQLLLDASFGMSVGETVVVGTFALDDVRTLLMLLSARQR